MLPRLALTVLSALVASVAAQENVIKSPSRDVWWVAGSQNTLTWDCKAVTRPTFTILIANKDPKILVAPLAIIGIQNNFDCSKSITQNQVTQPAGTGYTILFSEVSNQTAIFATSDEFELKPLGSAYPTVTPGLSSAAASGPSGSATQSGSAAQNTNKPNSAYSRFVTPGTVTGAALGAAAVAIFGF